MLQLNNLRLAPQCAPVQLKFESSQIGVILGRNNSGKTNLLRHIAGLMSPARGEVLLNGQALPSLRSGRRSVACVFQAFVNYPHWSVRQNIESPMRGSRNSRESGGAAGRSERRARVEQIAETLQLTPLLDRRPAELSGGQQQRLAIGRALASEAQILLLDEPFVNLDFRLRERLTQELGQLLRTTQTTALFASSDSRDAFALSDSLVLMSEQRVLQSGTALEVYRNPASLEAAHLMSEPAVNLVSDSAGPGLVQAIRPEHLVLDPANLSDGGSGAQRFQIAVQAIETSGSHTFVQGELHDADAGNTGKRPLWVVRLDGVQNVMALIKSDGSERADPAVESSGLLDVYVDPRNLLEIAQHGAT